jgi:hypothetical protein
MSDGGLPADEFEDWKEFARRHGRAFFGAPLF